MIVRHDPLLTRAAEFSDCERYRYRLRYCFDGSVIEPPRNPVVFVMLNPSIATELTPDPTITRCIGFAKAWGYSDLMVANMFAIRSTDPAALLTDPDPVGPENDEVLGSIQKSYPVIAAWGSHKATKSRVARVVELLDRPLLCLKCTTGPPWHPLYLKADTKPIPWAPPEAA